MEVLGALAAQAQMVSQCISALQYIKFVLNQHLNAGESGESLQVVVEDVDLVLNLICLIDREQILGCDEVMAGVNVVNSRAIDFKSFVEDLDRKFKTKGPIRKITLFLNSAQDHELLEDKRRDLYRANMGLVGILSVAKIGLRKMDNQVVINVITIEQVNEALRKNQGLEGSIVMAKFIRQSGISGGQGRELGDQGEVKLSEDDLGMLDAMVADAQARKEEIQNLPHVGISTARGFSSMINGSVGVRTPDKDAFVRSRRTVIKGNNSEATAFMINAEGLMGNFTSKIQPRSKDYLTKEQHGTRLLLAARTGEDEAVWALLDREDIQLDYKDENGRTPLSWAAGEGWFTVVTNLLIQGSDVESRDNTGRTPLSWAAGNGYKTVLSRLIRAGADVNTADDTGRTMLSWAAGQGQQAVVEDLLKRRIDAKFADNEGRTPLLWAIEQGQEAVAVRLLEAGSDEDSASGEDSDDSVGWLSHYMQGSIVATDLHPPDTKLNVHFHRPSCAHNLQQKDDNESVTHREDLRKQHICRTRMHDQLSILCGLGGVFPPGGTASNNFGRVSFSTKSASIYFTGNLDDSTSELLHDNPRNLLQQLKEALGGLISGAIHLQQSNFCCDQFTMLTASNHGEDPDQPLVRMNTIPFTYLDELHRHLETLEDGPNDSALTRSVSTSFIILNSLFDITIPMPSSFELKLHYCSLVVQLLCLGLVLYSRAHVEGLHPVYLTNPLNEVTLHGSLRNQSRVTIEPRELACMGKMVGGKVFVFSFRTTSQTFPVDTRALSSNLSATCEEIVDCWGPGMLLFASRELPSQKKIFGLVIRGGVIRKPNNADDLFHWGRMSTESEAASAETFSYWDRIVIGATVIDADRGSTVTVLQNETPGTLTSAPHDDHQKPGEFAQATINGRQPQSPRPNTSVTVNRSCDQGSDTIWNSMQGSLDVLGAWPDTWEFTERNATIQGGSQVVGQVGFTQTKQPGVPAKRTVLDRWTNEGNLSLLEELHGLQVSPCTGVAQRVPLRVLIFTDLVDYIRGLRINQWSALEKEIVNAMESKEQFDAFISGLEERPVMKVSMVDMVNKLLVRLKDTGFDKKGKHLAVMWPTRSKGHFCVKMNPEGDQAWCRMLEDNEWSTTFAVASKLCLETPFYKCRRSQDSWGDMQALSTFMFYKQPRRDATRCKKTWQITDGKWYWSGKKGSKVVFLARKEGNAVTNLDFPRILRLVSKEMRPYLSSLRWSFEVLVEITDTEQSGEEVLITSRS